MINEVKARIKFALNYCPMCSHKLNRYAHGLKKKWAHCDHCGFCTYEIYASEFKAIKLPPQPQGTNDPGSLYEMEL